MVECCDGKVCIGWFICTFGICLNWWALEVMRHHCLPFCFFLFSHELDIEENPDSDFDDNGSLLGFKHGSGQK